VSSGVDSLVHGILYRIGSDLLYMERGELGHDQHTILVWTGHIRSAGVVKPNVSARGTGSVLNCGVW
jgi:hypothetical protein